MALNRFLGLPRGKTYRQTLNLTPVVRPLSAGKTPKSLYNMAGIFQDCIQAGHTQAAGFPHHLRNIPALLPFPPMSCRDSLPEYQDIVLINGYRFLSLEECLEIKKRLNRPKDKKLIKELELKICLKDNYYFERKLRKEGINFIAGVDEVGRGPLVGPVVAACVVLPEHFNLDGLTDSKKLSEKKREYFYDEIMKQALGVGVGIISEKKIDEVNIYEATKMAMKEAINNCSCKVEHVLIDAMKLDIDIPTTSIIKGDLKSITISAASVIAKVTRDRMLDELDLKYPMYDFKNNKGYPTKKHLEAIKKYGIIDEHRRSYGPVSEYLELTK